MGQQQNQKETHHTEQQAVLSGLDAKINGLDVAIASLMAEQHSLNRAREYVLSTDDKVSGTSNDNTAPANPSSKLPLTPTYLSSLHQVIKRPSCLRQEVLIRNAMEKDKSSSPPGSTGLLSSDEFEASFPDRNPPGVNNDSDGSGSGADIGAGDYVRPSIEGMSSSTAENHPGPSPITPANAISRSTTPSPGREANTLSSSSRNSQGAHWHAKRVTKRKLQDNAAKAREVRRRKLKANSMAA